MATPSCCRPTPPAWTAPPPVDAGAGAAARLLRAAPAGRGALTIPPCARSKAWPRRSRPAARRGRRGSEIEEKGRCASGSISSSGQKTGWFHDQRENRARVAALARGASVLDAFRHTGGFGLLLRSCWGEGGHAARPLRTALRLAMDTAARHGLAERVHAQRAEAMEALPAATAAAGARFDIVVADPPAFARSRKDHAAALRAYARLARVRPRWWRRAALLFLASRSHHVSAAEFATAWRRGCPVPGGWAASWCPAAPGPIIRCIRCRGKRLRRRCCCSCREGAAHRGRAGGASRHLPRTRLPPRMLRAWRRTLYLLAGRIAVRIGRRSPAADALLAALGARQGVIVTAWNPFGRRRPEGWNRRAGARLRQARGGSRRCRRKAVSRLGRGGAVAGRRSGGRRCGWHGACQGGVVHLRRGAPVRLLLLLGGTAGRCGGCWSVPLPAAHTNHPLGG